MLNADVIHCCEILISKKLTIAFAESASAGRMVAEFAMVPDAGKFLKGGFVCYDVGLKEEVLGVPKQLIERCTPESAEVTAALADGLGSLIKANVHVALTGLPAAGGSETKDKPVGTMFVHANLNGTCLIADRIYFTGEPEEIILKTIYHTAERLAQKLDGIG